jgi:hypothetical protein
MEYKHERRKIEHYIGSRSFANLRSFTNLAARTPGPLPPLPQLHTYGICAVCKIQRILIFGPRTTFDFSSARSTLGVRRTTQASKMTLALATSSTSHRRAGASAGYIRHVHCACSLSSGRFHVPSKALTNVKCQRSHGGAISTLS